jgi:flagellar biosynthesis GTPase FlhF
VSLEAASKIVMAALDHEPTGLEEGKKATTRTDSVSEATGASPLAVVGRDVWVYDYLSLEPSETDAKVWQHAVIYDASNPALIVCRFGEWNYNYPPCELFFEAPSAELRVVENGEGRARFVRPDSKEQQRQKEQKKKEQDEKEKKGKEQQKKRELQLKEKKEKELERKKKERLEQEKKAELEDEKLKQMEEEEKKKQEQQKE